MTHRRLAWALAATCALLGCLVALGLAVVAGTQDSGPWLAATEPAPEASAPSEGLTIEDFAILRVTTLTFMDHVQHFFTAVSHECAHMTSTRIQRATIAACFRDAYADLSPQTASARDTYRALGLRAGRECHTRIVRLRRSMSGLADAAHTVRQIGVRAAPALRRARRASAQVLSSARTFRRATISALTHCAPGGPADTAQDAMTV